jgi:hypothetical protein
VCNSWKSIVEIDRNSYNNLSSTYLKSQVVSCAEGKFLVTKFEFGGSFGMSLDEDYHELEVNPDLELFVTFGMGL